MSLVPHTLDGWTHEVVKALIEANAHETDFDWKAQLPPDPNGRRRLNDCVAALANGGGGFIVFGVTDVRGARADDRIVGVDPTIDFPKEFSDKLHECDPPAATSVRADGIVIPSSTKVLRVVHVRPDLAPHSVAGRFMTRVPGSAREMSTDEVRTMILRNEDLRAKLRLLMLELVSARAAARAMDRFAETNTFTPVRRIDTATISRLHAETLPLLAPVYRASESLTVLCGAAEALNYQLDCIAPLIGEALGQSLDFTGAAQVIARAARSRSEVERTAEVILNDMVKLFPDPTILKILMSEQPGYVSS